MQRLLPSIIFFSSALLYGQSFTFDFMIRDHSNQIAPDHIQKAMRQIAKDDIEECLSNGDLNEEKLKTFFLSFPIKLAKGQQDMFLILPSRGCMTFFGAHCFAYWILRTDKNKEISVLWSSRDEGINLLPTSHNGLHDLECWYGMASFKARFDGKKYFKATESKPGLTSPSTTPPSAARTQPLRGWSG